jgi:tRNA pseudouridine55 synthase
MNGCGLLNLNKPQGWTSREAVDRVKKLVRPAKTGHAGTLDPLATGVLIICVGSATRLIQYVQRMPKSYTATFLLGRTSDTEDIAGQVVELDRPPQPAAEQIRAAAATLLGTIRQRPPAFSALKVHGQRAYKLARAGTPVELEPREVHIYQLDVVDYEYPRLTLRVKCGSGTYVRSLGRDLAESLGTGGVMSSLVRTAIGGFRVEDAVEPADLSAENLSQLLAPPVAALQGMPQMVLSAEEVVAVRQGKTLARELPPTEQAEQWAAISPQGAVVAVLERPYLGLLRSTCVLPE